MFWILPVADLNCAAKDRGPVVRWIAGAVARRHERVRARAIPMEQNDERRGLRRRLLNGDPMRIHDAAPCENDIWKVTLLLGAP